MGLIDHLETPLPWYTERIWNYHEQKAADSALFTGVAYAVLRGVYALGLLASPVAVWQAALIAGLAYLVIGKAVSYFNGAVGWGTPLEELADFFADGVTGQLVTVLFAWPVVGLGLGAALFAAWCVAYALLAWVARP